ncbi:MAG: hypothetical protein HY826_02685 [Actinobacteria bacterium]|nr:hypothetical protein [Actinomycetota bacterium]
MPTAAPPRLFGFPLHVGSGFWLFMGLIAFANSSYLGLDGAVVFAALIAGLTVVHELGHAFAARATGARAEISLAFMVGYASFTPTRKLSRWEHVGISFAGPATQIIVGGAVYLALGGPVWPLEGLTNTQFSALWAGPVIGLFNLLPILPFDGGNILEQAVGALLPKHARPVMLWFSVVLSVVGIVVLSSRPELRGFVIFMMIPLLTVGQMLFSGRAARNHASSREAFARAEALAWATGDVSGFTSEHLPSPWFRAHQQLQQGHPDVARQVLLADFADSSAVNWWPPDAASVRDLEALINLLGSPLPHGRAFSDFVLSGILLRLGRYEAAGAYAATAYQAARPAMLAVHVARAAAALGDNAMAAAWLRAAANTAPAEALQVAIAAAPEFQRMRNDPEFTQALAP